jgi:hypothetical protein
VPDLLHNGSGNTFPSFDEGGSIYPGGVDKNPALIMNRTPYPQSGLNPAGENPATKQYDCSKVQAVINWINGVARALPALASCRPAGGHAGPARHRQQVKRRDRGGQASYTGA